MNRTIKLAILASVPLILTGCATLPGDTGFADMRQGVQDRLGERVEWRRGGPDDAAVDERVRATLQQPLTVDAAVQVALLNNRALQAEYEELGVAQADLLQAGLLNNPTFGWARQVGGDLTKTTWGLEVDFLGILLTVPKRRIEDIRFQHAKLRVTQAVLRHAMETRKAWFEAVAAEQEAAFMAQVAELGALEAELGERQRKAGNLSRRDALRRQAFAAETEAALTRAREAAYQARERLARLMGLDQEADWRLPERLPGLPPTAPLLDGIEEWGLDQRLDLQMARKESEAMTAALELTRETRFVNVLGLGVETEKTTGERRLTGPRLSVELPLFDQGQARLARQAALHRQSIARLQAMTTEARSEIRAGARRVATAYMVARQQREVLVPLHHALVGESLLHYNGMLIGVHELLADARARIGAVQAEIAATREFWIALAELQMAVGGHLPVTPAPEDTTARPSQPHEEHTP